LFNPFLREHFSNSFKAQFEEFARLYGKAPSHIDGHHHMHLCANMVVSALIPAGTKIRRNFSFWPGEKSLLNRTYRACVDRQLARKYRLTDYFFDLSQSVNGKKMDRVAALATQANVELMTHPILKSEMEYLAGDEFFMMTQRVQLGSYGAL
jgi:chitin disaccharide deacetylase